MYLKTEKPVIFSWLHFHCQR